MLSYDSRIEVQGDDCMDYCKASLIYPCAPYTSTTSQFPLEQIYSVSCQNPVVVAYTYYLKLYRVVSRPTLFNVKINTRKMDFINLFCIGFYNRLDICQGLHLSNRIWNFVYCLMNSDSEPVQKVLFKKIIKPARAHGHQRQLDS